MTVLITGGAGFVGSHMALELLDAGEDVVVLDNLSTGLRQAVPPAATFVQGNVGNSDLVSSLLSRHKIDAIIHFAGSVVVPESVADPLKYYCNNTCNSHALIACAIKNNVKQFIFSSTAAVYGIPEVNPVSEAVRPDPISPYGSSKLMTEIMLHDVARAHDLRYMALRYFNVAGADPRGRSGQSTPQATHLIKAATQVALGLRPSLEVFGTDYRTPDGTCIRDYIHVSDLTNAHLAALRHLRDGGDSETLNCGYGRGYSVLEVIDSVKRACGHDFAVHAGPRRPGDPVALIADSQRIENILGWEPSFNDLDTIVGHALDWERRIIANGGSAATR
jgi:UDP-glucose 4-epimerase